MSEVIEVEVRGDFFELYKLLKSENIAQSGGQAKLMIEQGDVKVNGKVELRKRCKLVRGDKVLIAGVTLQLT